MFDKLFGDKSSIDRVVGGTKKEQKKARDVMERRFKNQEFADLKKVERVKTPEDLEMIELVNRETDALREKYGLSEYRVPPENYHIVPNRWLEEHRPNTRGNFIPMLQGVVLRGEDTRRSRIGTMFHETVHFKSYASVQGDREKERRIGVSAMVEGEDEMYFGPMNEAITEELTKRFMKAHEDVPALARETAEIKRFASGLKDEAERDDLAYFDVRKGEKGTTLSFMSHSYPKERKALNLLIDKLKERNPKTFRDKEEWFDMFAGAMFNGHLLELARAIEGTFGKGKFRELGEQKTGEDFLKFVEAL